MSILMERLSDCDHLYQTIVDFYLDGMKKSPSSSPQMTKDHLGQLLSLAQTDRERECIKYAVFKTSGLSASAAQKFYGFSDMTRRADRVERAIEEAQRIREDIQSLAAIQDKAILSHGINLPRSSSSSDSEESAWMTIVLLLVLNTPKYQTLLQVPRLSTSLPFH